MRHHNHAATPASPCHDGWAAAAAGVEVHSHSPSPLHRLLPRLGAPLPQLCQLLGIFSHPPPPPLPQATLGLVGVLPPTWEAISQLLGILGHLVVEVDGGGVLQEGGGVGRDVGGVWVVGGVGVWGGVRVGGWGVSHLVVGVGGGGVVPGCGGGWRCNGGEVRVASWHSVGSLAVATMTADK